jgi:hypothetical protein
MLRRECVRERWVLLQQRGDADGLLRLVYVHGRRSPLRGVVVADLCDRELRHLWWAWPALLPDAILRGSLLHSAEHTLLVFELAVSEL